MKSPPIKVLLIEEDKASLDLLRKTLQPLGHQIFSARTSQEALIFSQSTSLDLVLIDVDLSDGQGFSTISRMLKDSPSLKVVACLKFLSRHGFQAKALAQSLGACAILLKPYDSLLVQKVVLEALAS